MERFFLFIFFSFLSCFSFSQEIDTVNYSYRTGGELDSVDFSYSFPMSTFSGGVLDGLNNYLSTNLIYSNLSLLNFVKRPIYSKMKFSALPHLGFSYSFVGNGTQFVHFDYLSGGTRYVRYDLRRCLMLLQNHGRRIGCLDSLAAL